MLRLITIPVSHYCEKARWALERAGLPYREEAHLQIFHYVATFSAGGGATVPLLIHDDGVIGESTEIMRWADARGSAPTLFPAAKGGEVDALVRDFDERLGKSARLWAYWELLPHRDLLIEHATAGAPGWQKRLMPMVWPAAVRYLAWRLGMNEATAAEARDECFRIFDEVARRLRDGRRYLCGDRITAADITFASLGAPLLCAPKYGGPLPPIEALPKRFGLELTGLREHPTGQFVFRLYDEERRAVPS
jgi:glutathione S-transferase